jgi:glycosyltransferase involved in cell wall biosynthesis
MHNAAIYLHPNGFDTTGAALLGRHSAGESFLRGLLRHAEVDTFHFWNVAGEEQAKIDALVERIETPRKPIRWIGQADRQHLRTPGVVYLPGPSLDAEAFHRQPFGSRSYAMCGVTHTTATAAVMRILPDLLVAPLEGYDALICTSSAVREAVETQLGMMRDYLRAEFGPRKRPELMRMTIPLGVNAADFTPTPAHRTAWRERLGIPDDAIVALYVGRHSVKMKMNPALMAMALARAAQKTDQRLYWLNSGWVEPASEEANFHEQVRALCPSVTYLSVDGRQPDVRFSIWSAADFFISFSDNIQETFGLTPIEAMAAGLPSVVSDWNGYKDTVRHGLDGFRVPTVSPRPGYGGDLAYWFANNWMNYENYVGAAAQYTAIDLDEAAAAILALVESPELRRTMGEAAARRAREVFDWRAIIPQYQALWAEQDARRLAAAPDTLPRANPYRPDPYTLFAGYPSRHLQHADVISLRPGLDWPAIRTRLNGPLAAYSRFNRPTGQELERVIARLATGPAPVSELLDLVVRGRRNYMERGLIWLARYDVVSIMPAPV